MLNIHRELFFTLKESDKNRPVEGFASYIAPVMSMSVYKNQSWQNIEVLPYGPLPIYPDAKVLHYAQEIFEGLKAYWVDSKHPQLFRPHENATRFNHSARRMAMPEIPEEIFLEAIKAVVDLNKDFIPKESAKSLYLRPFMYASENQLGIRPCSEYTFMVLASPTAGHFSDEARILIERHHVRAVSGGTGTAKTGGNYAAAQIASHKAKELGLHQVLWLDAKERKYLEELSGMNIFFVHRDGSLHTPALTDTILNGITRKSLIELCQNELNIPLKEEKLAIDDILKGIQSGEFVEAFACGTAAIIAPIKSLVEEDGKEFSLKSSHGEITKKLRQQLLDIQEGRSQTRKKEWIVEVAPFIHETKNKTDRYQIIS